MKKPITYSIRELAALNKLAPLSKSEKREIESLRPRNRSECINGPRPCPFVSCRHHLYSDVSSKGSLIINFPDRELWNLKETCCLDLANRDNTLEEVGAIFNVTRERIRQIQDKSLDKLSKSPIIQDWGKSTCHLSDTEFMRALAKRANKKKKKYEQQRIRRSKQKF